MNGIGAGHNAVAVGVVQAEENLARFIGNRAGVVAVGCVEPVGRDPPRLFVMLQIARGRINVLQLRPIERIGNTDFILVRRVDVEIVVAVGAGQEAIDRRGLGQARRPVDSIEFDDHILGEPFLIDRVEARRRRCRCR